VFAEVLHRFGPDRLQQKSGIAHKDAIWGDIRSHQGIRANPCVLADLNGAHDLCACSNVDMSRDFGDPLRGSADSHLLKDQAIATYTCGGMYNNSIWMRNKQSSANIRVYRNICTCDRRPEAVS
jgi:hypothetical protein